MEVRIHPPQPYRGHRIADFDVGDVVVRADVQQAKDAYMLVRGGGAIGALSLMRGEVFQLNDARFEGRLFRPTRATVNVSPVEG